MGNLTEFAFDLQFNLL